jgi:threonine aldolase
MSRLKFSFKNDYSELAHPDVLKALFDIGNEQFEGYGLDEHSLKASELIKARIAMPSADVHFISGGTQANLVVISSVLRPHEAVIACESGHIFVHEAGAIEATGHKICVTKGNNGKLSAGDIETVINIHTDEHMVKPCLVFISQSTEVGSVYTKAELRAISECCRNNKLFLYLDGARLGAGLNSFACDLTYSDIADLVDVFYIGGTKNGALFGEVIIICKDDFKADFRFHLKQKGALIAKGASIGAQYEVLFENGLYDELARHANDMALRLADGIKKLGYGFLLDAETNQIFPIFPTDTTEKLHNLYDFYDWRQIGDMTAVRLVTSWAAPEKFIDEFIDDLARIK